MVSPAWPTHAGSLNHVIGIARMFGKSARYAARQLLLICDAIQCASFELTFETPFSTRQRNKTFTFKVRQRTLTALLARVENGDSWLTHTIDCPRRDPSRTQRSPTLCITESV